MSDFNVSGLISADSSAFVRAAQDTVGNLRRIAGQVDGTTKAFDTFNYRMRVLDNDMARGKVTGEQYAAFQQRFQQELEKSVASQDQVAQSSGRMRFAMINAGQQVQDIAVQLQGGQRAAVVFAQQLPQLSFALSGLQGSSNKVASAVGSFATFMSGPWGAAISVGAMALGPLIAKLFETKGAAEKTQESLERIAKYAFPKNEGVATLREQTKNTGDALREMQTNLQKFRDAQARDQSTSREVRRRANRSNAIEEARRDLQESMDNLAAQRRLLGAVMNRFRSTQGGGALNDPPGSGGGGGGGGRSTARVTATDAQRDSDRAAAAAARDAAEAQRDLEAATQAVTDRFDPAARVAQDYADTLANIGKAVASGKYSAAQGLIFASQAEQDANRDRFKALFGYSAGGSDDPFRQQADAMLQTVPSVSVFRDRMKEAADTSTAAWVTATQRISGALQSLQSGFGSGGGFLGKLSAIVDVGLALGGAGLFGKKIAANINAVPGYAGGTSFHPGGLAMVGERGPELVNLPRGSAVYPNGTGPGGGNVYNIKGNLLTPEFWTQIQAMDVASAQAGAAGGEARVRYRARRSLG